MSNSSNTDAGMNLARAKDAFLKHTIAMKKTLPSVSVGLVRPARYLLCAIIVLAATLALGVGEVFALSIIPGENENLFGMTTPAGSGRHLATPRTNICKVTNLRDDGVGSLRDCLETPAPRTILFEVSGTIHLKSNLSVPQYTTLAGQTAPSPGITLKGWALGVKDDTLVQHIRIRVGDHPRGNAYVERDAASTQGNNIVFDHNSLSWSIDELVNGAGSNITYRNNIFSEALHSPLHPKGGHSRGLLVTGNYGTDDALNVAVIGNLFAHNMTRNPVFSSKAKGIVVNNVNYDVNVAPKCDDHGDVQVCSVYNNVLEQSGKFVARAGNDATQIYYGDHIINGEFMTYPETWDYTSTPFGRGVPEANRVSSSPITIPDFTPRPTNEVWDWVLLNAGARPADRDPVDVRIVQDAQTGTGEVIASQSEVGGWPVLEENIRSLTPPSNADEIQPSGYTALEEWLHVFSEYVEGKSTALPEGVGETMLSPTPTPSALVWTVPNSVFQGQAIDLYWEGVHVNGCTGMNFSTGGAPSGSVVIYPDETGTYGVSCTGPGGTAVDEFEVGVVPTPQSQDQVLHFEFEEGSGTVIHDASGHGFIGTIDGASWTSGHSGGGLAFDGADDIVQTDFNFGNLSKFTTTLWMKPTLINGREGVLGMHGLTIHYNLGRWEFVVGGKDREICRTYFNGNPLEVGVWNFVAISYDGEDCSIHYNNEYYTFAAEDWESLREYDMRLGRGNGAYSDSWFEGVIDDLRFYNYALTEEEIETVRDGGELVSAAPVANLFVNPVSIPTGDSAILTWTSTDANTCVGTGFDTSGMTSGTVTIHPTETTTYSLSCNGDAGSGETTFVLHVYDPDKAVDLLAWWDMEEGFGDTAYDSSGNGSNATIDGATWAAGRGGSVLEFDGVDDIVRTGYNPDDLTQLTATLWVYPHAFDGREGVLGGYGGLTIHNGGRWGFVLDGDDGRICSTAYDDKPVLNAWNFMAISYDGKDCGVQYLDNYSVVSAQDNKTPKDQPIRIGRGNLAYGDSWFDGMVDDVRIYDRALTQAEIEAVRNNTEQVAPTFQADFNADSTVNIFDYNLLLMHFGATVNCGNPADANGDCAVNIFDYNVLLGEFGRSG